jgi:hypothetical protein
LAHQPAVWVEISPTLPAVHTLKRQVPLPPDVLPIAKKLCRVPVLGVTLLPENQPTGNPDGTNIDSTGPETQDIILPPPRKITKDARHVLPMPKKINQPPQKMSPPQVNLPVRPSTYSPAVYASTDPKVWYNALLAVHHQLRESPETRIPYGQAANFHIRASKLKLVEEREITSDLKHLKSKLRDFRHMLQTRLNSV